MKSVRKPFVKFRIDCGALGVQETWARSPAEALSRVRWRMRNEGVFAMTAYWGEPVAVVDQKGGV